MGMFMNPTQTHLNVNLDPDSITELLVRAIETGMGKCLTAFLQALQNQGKHPLASKTGNTRDPIGESNGNHATHDVRLIDVHAVAAMLSVSARMVYRLRDSGGMPKPLIIGRLVRWRKEAIDEWIQAGCPRARPIGAKKRNVR